MAHALTKLKSEPTSRRNRTMEGGIPPAICRANGMNSVVRSTALSIAADRGKRRQVEWLREDAPVARIDKTFNYATCLLLALSDAVA